jgi:hypothetical protein
MKVYEIPFEIEAAFAIYENLLTESQGEVTPEVEAAELNLKTILEQGSDKIEAAACVIRNLESEEIALKAEAARLMARGSSAGANAARLKAVIGMALPALGGKVKTPKFTVYTQKNPTSYDLTVAPDVDLAASAVQFPELFKVIVEPRKSTLTDAYKQGVPLPTGFVITEKPETYSTRIK